MPRTVKISGHAYNVGTNAIQRANAFRLLDGTLYMNKGRVECGAPQFAEVVETTLDGLWEGLPNLELDALRTKPPRFLLGFEGRIYELRIIPWSFARTHDTKKVLHIHWRNDNVNWFAANAVRQLTDPEQLLELLPLAQLA
jgi:hypothetical protein